jgi:4-amino-4-deoxy-L-arabinose transferase-like glycosyltransferase
MINSSGLETSTNGANSHASGSDAGAQADSARSGSLKRTLWFVGIAAVSAAVAYAIVRSRMSRPPDPTTERIQQLIDEANRLLKQLDDQKPD